MEPRRPRRRVGQPPRRRSNVALHHLAYLEYRRYQTPSERLLAQQPRSRLRRRGPRHRQVVCPGSRLVSAWRVGRLHRRKNRHANPPAKTSHDFGRTGKPERREHEYIRHGARCLIASFVVPTGRVVWDLGVTRTSVDFAAHLAHVASQFPDQQRCHWVLDNLNTHWSLDVCELLAKLNGLPFPKKDLRTGKQRRAFLTDPDHQHVFN